MLRFVAFAAAMAYVAADAPPPPPAYKPAPPPPAYKPAPPPPAYKPAPAYKEPVHYEPKPYAYEYAVKDDYSGANFGAQETADGKCTICQKVPFLVILQNYNGENG